MPNCIGAERVRLRLSQTDLGDKLASAEASSCESNAIRSRQLTINSRECRSCSGAPSSTCSVKLMIVFPRRTRLHNERQREAGAVGEQQMAFQIRGGQIHPSPCRCRFRDSLNLARSPPSTVLSIAGVRGPSTSTLTTSTPICAGRLSLRSRAMTCRTRSTPLCCPCKRACQSAWPATAVRGPHDVSRIVPEDCSI